MGGGLEGEGSVQGTGPAQWTFPGGSATGEGDSPIRRSVRRHMMDTEVGAARQRRGRGKRTMKQILGLAAAIGITSLSFLALAIGPAFADGAVEGGRPTVLAAD